MTRRDVDYLVIAAMLISGLYVTASGLVAGLFGFSQFFLHRYAGYLCAALVVVHLALNWKRVTVYLRQRFGPAPERPAPASAQAEKAPLWGRRQLLLSGLAAAGGFVLGWLLPRRQAELPYEAADIGEVYHQWSKPGYEQVLGALSNWGGQPAPYKTYPGAERIVLPDPGGYQGLSVEEAIEKRRSVRAYSGEALSLEELSRLLHAAQGLTDTRRRFRAAPSAGALYPIELYAVVHNVAGIDAGLYHYAVREHALELLRRDDLRLAIMQAGLGQGFLRQANVCFVLSAIFQRLRWRYRERAYRYALLEAGHIGQNLYLAATSMGMGACAVGAFLDDELNGLVGLDGKKEATLYAIAVGKM